MRQPTTPVTASTPAASPTNSSQAEFLTEVGQPRSMITGYIADGLFQNYKDIAGHAIQTSNGVLTIDPNQGSWVGDIKFRDIKEVTLRRGILQRIYSLGTIYLATLATGSTSNMNPFVALGFGNVSASGVSVRDIADPDADLSAFLQANLDWHVGVAMAGHNELLIGFMTALSHAIYTGTENAAFVDDNVRAVTARAHRSVTTAIRSRDAETAGRRMRRHVHSYAKAALAMDERESIEVDD